MNRAEKSGISGLIYWVNFKSLEDIIKNKSLKPNKDLLAKKRVCLRYISKNFCGQNIDNDYLPRSALIACKAKFVEESKIIGLIFDSKLLNRNDYIINLEEKNGKIDEYTINPEDLDKGITRALHIKNIGRKIYEGDSVFIKSQTVANKVLSLRNEVIYSKPLSINFLRKIIIYLDTKYIVDNSNAITQEIKNLKEKILKIFPKNIDIEILENFPEL